MSPVPTGICPSGMLTFWTSIDAICQIWQQKLIVFSRQWCTSFSICCSLPRIYKLKLLCPPKEKEPLFFWLVSANLGPRPSEQSTGLSCIHAPQRAPLFILWGSSRLGHWPRWEATAFTPMRLWTCVHSFWENEWAFVASKFILPLPPGVISLLFKFWKLVVYMGGK